MKGTLCCIAGDFLLSPDSLLVRLASSLPGMEVIFFKYLFMFGTLLFYLICKDKTKLVNEVGSLGWLEWMAALLWGVSNLTLNIGFQNTSVATVLVINSSNSLFAALGSYWFLKEELKYRTIFTIIACFGALVYICCAELSDANANVLGLLSALVSSVTLGAYLVLLRYIEKTNR